jgi:hypothetical protein
MVGGIALERAGQELAQAEQRHDRAEAKLENHRYKTGYRSGLVERMLYAFSDLHREKQPRTLERQTALELEAARGRRQQIERWLEEPAQRRLVIERVGELRQRDQQLVRELRQERSELAQVREIRHELAQCPEQQRELKLEGRSLKADELIRDEGLKQAIGEKRGSAKEELIRSRGDDRAAQRAGKASLILAHTRRCAAADQAGFVQH